MDAEAREHFVEMGAEILALAEELEREVAPPVWDRICRLTTLVDDHAASRILNVADEERNRVLAHFGPDFARLFAIVQHHILHDALPACAVYQRPQPGSFLPEEVCTLPPVDPWTHPEK